MKDEDVQAAETPHRVGLNIQLPVPWNDRQEVLPKPHHMASTAPVNPKKKAKETGPVDMEMYVRPQPDLRTDDYKDGYDAGYDGDKFQVRNMNWAHGYRDGQSDAAEHKKEMDKTGSSNA